MSGCGNCARSAAQFHDGQGRLLQIRSKISDTQQAVVNQVYDARGLVTASYAPEAEAYTSAFSRPAGWDARPKTAMQYDALGRVTVITSTDGTTTTTAYRG